MEDWLPIDWDLLLSNGEFDGTRGPPRRVYVDDDSRAAHAILIEGESISAGEQLEGLVGDIQALLDSCDPDVIYDSDEASSGLSGHPVLAATPDVRRVQGRDDGRRDGRMRGVHRMRSDNNKDYSPTRRPHKRKRHDGVAHDEGCDPSVLAVGLLQGASTVDAGGDDPDTRGRGDHAAPVVVQGSRRIKGFGVYSSRRASRDKKPEVTKKAPKARRTDRLRDLRKKVGYSRFNWRTANGVR